MAARRRGRGGGRFLRGGPPPRRLPGWPLILAAAAGVALLTAAALTGDNGLSTWRRLRGERDRAAAEVEALRARRQALEARIEALRSDPAALEQLAREKYSLQRPGEEVIEIVGDEQLRGRLPAPPPPSAAGPEGAARGLARQRPNAVPAYPPPADEQTEPKPDGKGAP